MWQWISKLIQRPHRHNWRGSCWNRYMVAMEETCEGCGKRRHLRDFADSRDDNWQDGPNPIADKMRQEGVTCNY